MISNNTREIGLQPKAALRAAGLYGGLYNPHGPKHRPAPLSNGYFVLSFLYPSFCLLNPSLFPAPPPPRFLCVECHTIPSFIRAATPTSSVPRTAPTPFSFALSAPPSPFSVYRPPQSPLYPAPPPRHFSIRC